MRVLRDPPPPVDEPRAHSRQHQPLIEDGCKARLEIHFRTTSREHRSSRVTSQRVPIMDAQRTVIDRRSPGRRALVACHCVHVNTGEEFGTLDAGHERYR